MDLSSSPQPVQASPIHRSAAVGWERESEITLIRQEFKFWCRIHWNPP